MATLVATRKSPLALRQAELVCARLKEHGFTSETQLLPLNTEVDKRLEWSLEKRGGLGLFTKELEDALFANKATLAVHSAKDLPTELPEGLTLAGFLPRANPHDILVFRSGETDGIRSIATSSPRRRHQLKERFPHAEWKTLRGNVETRLRKIKDGEADATVLAAAGLERLGIDQYEGLSFETLSIDSMVPAPGQAAIAIQCRSERSNEFESFFCSSTAQAVELERSFLRGLGSGCQIPVGAHYSDGSFYIYHPDCGFYTIDLELPPLELAQATADALISKLNLK